MESLNILKRIRSHFDHDFRRRLFKNLAIKGGGVRGIAYVGALNALEDLGILDNIERVAGTSAGAIGATLISFRLNMAETTDIFNSLTFSKIPQDRTDRSRLPFIESGNLACVDRFFSKYGWYSSNYFHQWLGDVIAAQCDGNRRATFAEFEERGFRELFIVATNLSRHRAELFSAKTTPNVAVADAVRMSMSIPFVFEAMRFDGEKFGAGDYYVDGGIYDNFPMHIFDEPQYAEKNWAHIDGINWETLGLFLYSEHTDLNEPKHPEDLWHFLALAMSNMLNAFDQSENLSRKEDKQRTIEISDCGISAVEFDIEPGSEKYMQLYTEGQRATYAFFGQDEPAPEDVPSE